MSRSSSVSRRHLLAQGAAVVGVAGFPSLILAMPKRRLTPTESIEDMPEYIHGAPLRTSFLEDGSTAQRIRVEGRALSTTGQSLIGARFDFWHTDSNGAYDMAGFKFRGAQLTDKRGRFHLDTVMPGPYGNPRHIHFMLATRMGNEPQPHLLSGAIYFPTKEEFESRPPERRIAEFLPPESLSRVNDVLVARCDVVMDVA